MCDLVFCHFLFLIFLIFGCLKQDEQDGQDEQDARGLGAAQGSSCSGSTSLGP